MKKLTQEMILYLADAISKGFSEDLIAYGGYRCGCLISCSSSKVGHPGALEHLEQGRVSDT